MPLIVRYSDAAAKSRTTPKVAGSTVVRRLDSIQGAAVAQNRKRASAFWSALTGASGTAARSASPAFAGGIAKVRLDGKVKADLADSTAQIGAQQVWAEGDTGTGVKVAVLDSGVDTAHPDLTGQVDTSASFVPYEEDVADFNGHGTSRTTYADPLVKRAAKPLPAGSRTLTAVYVCEGTAQALARQDVRGKAVVVRGSDPAAIKEQAEAAATAGAQMLMVVNDGIGRLQPWDETPWSPESPAPLTVATLNADQGADLIDALQHGAVKLKVT